MSEKLFDAALSARDNAHAHYSGFQVGAAVLTGDGPKGIMTWLLCAFWGMVTI